MALRIRLLAAALTAPLTALAIASPAANATTSTGPIATGLAALAKVQSGAITADSITARQRHEIDAVTLPTGVTEETPIVHAISSTDPALIGASTADVAHTNTVLNSATSGCWSMWIRWRATATAGNTLFTWWLGLAWCSSGGQISSYHVFDRGGESSTPGWSFVGNGGAGSWNVGWEVRQYVQERFSFGIGWFSYTDTRCGQIRGGATVLYSASASCGLN